MKDSPLKLELSLEQRQEGHAKVTEIRFRKHIVLALGQGKMLFLVYLVHFAMRIYYLL